MKCQSKRSVQVAADVQRRCEGDSGLGSHHGGDSQERQELRKGWGIEKMQRKGINLCGRFADARSF